VKSAEKVRLLVFSLFFVVLLIFAVLYKPTEAISRPADKGNSQVMPTGRVR